MRLVLIIYFSVTKWNKVLISIYNVEKDGWECVSVNAVSYR